MDNKGDRAKTEGLVDDKVVTVETTKSKRKPPKGSKTKLVATKPPQPTGRQFDWPKKNYFEVTCVAAESSDSGQRMVICYLIIV